MLSSSALAASVAHHIGELYFFRGSLKAKVSP
jgi:hypothetical protein